MFRQKRIITTLLISMSAIALLLLFSPSTSLPTTDRRLVLFEMGAIRLLVPRNYLLVWVKPKGTQDAPYMMGIATVPAFAGATQSDISCFNMFTFKNCNVVMFSSSGLIEPEADQNGWRWYSRTEERLEPSDFGLMRSTKLRGFYVSLAPNDRDNVSIVCSNGLCSTNMSVAKIQWEIRFGEKILPQWRAIMDGMADLISKFEDAAHENRLAASR